MYEELRDLFFAHASDVNCSFDMPSQLRFYTTHGSKSRHVQHLAIAQFDAFTLVSSTENGLHDPIGRARREFIQLFLPGRSSLWGLSILNKLVALILAQFHSHLLLIKIGRASCRDRVLMSE